MKWIIIIVYVVISLHVYEIATFLLQLICVCLLADLLVDCSSVVNVSQYISFFSSQKHFQEPALLSVNTLASEFIFSILVSLHFLLVLTMRVCLMSTSHFLQYHALYGLFSSNIVRRNKMLINLGRSFHHCRLLSPWILVPLFLVFNYWD